MIKADASMEIKKTDVHSIRGCEVQITGEYPQIMGEFKTLTTAMIDTILQRAPKVCKYDVANDLIGVLQSGASKVAEFIIKEDENA